MSELEESIRSDEKEGACDQKVWMTSQVFQKSNTEVSHPEVQKHLTYFHVV
jgi:hypothetical protein